MADESGPRHRKRRRSQSPEVLAMIEAHHALGVSAPQILQAMERDEAVSKLSLPGVRTIQNIIRDLPAGDGSGLWSVAVDDGVETRFVLDVLREVIAQSQGRVRTLTTAEVGVLKVIAKAAPDLPRLFAYLTARRYLAAQAKHESTVDLDAYLAFEPWAFDEKEEVSGEGGYMNQPAYRGGVEAGWFENRDFQLGGELRDFLAQAGSRFENGR